MAFASWWYQTHANEKTSGSPSKPGEKKGPDEVSASSAAASKPFSMNPAEAKAVPVSTEMEGPHPHSKKRHRRQDAKTEPDKSQSTKPPVDHEKKPQEGKPKEHAKPKSAHKHASDGEGKHGRTEKTASRSKEPVMPVKATEPETKPQDTKPAGGKSVVAGTAAAPGKAGDQKKEKKSLAAAALTEPKPDEPSGKSGMDAALDDLIDTLGEPSETQEDSTAYTGPEVSDPMSSTYIEELGKREVTIPPKYRELLEKKIGVAGPPPDSVTPLGPDDAIDALSSDFTCSSPVAGGKEAGKEAAKSAGEVLEAQSAKVMRAAAPPQEKKRKVEEDAMSDQALEALSASLGTRMAEPELDLSSIKEVDEAKAKEEKVEKCGEDDETVPAEYRLKPATDKDGKPLLPEPEEKPKPRSESELIDELSKDFSQAKSNEKQPKPTGKTEESKAAVPAPVAEAVPRTSMCSVQSAPPKPASLKGMVPDDAVEALAGSLGRKEPDPEAGKPVADKVKEKSKEEDREKLGEKEETIPPDYRLEEAKDKDGKPLPPSEPTAQLPALSEDLLLDALSEDFSGPSSASSLKFDDAMLSAAVSEVVSQSPASVTHAAAPPPDTQPSNKELDDALDKLSDSLGQRQPDPDENKPLEDKVKERAKKEHRDKLGERDDTIPPEYRHLLDQGEQDKPEKPPTKKSKEIKKPAGDQDPIDALSGDLDSCPPATETSQATEKDKSKTTTASSSKAAKHGDKAKDSAQTTEETSKPKPNEKNAS
ncbi:calpastatin isoform X5 [Lepus europaeus]|uniref:calpastatin isoform X5 n=1 Tax=Lepus europaeus TaxID=9983 RepID=UPI002B4593DB|nr:calpastatin isoform X5 [Lepus europaeus]